VRRRLRYFSRALNLSSQLNCTSNVQPTAPQLKFSFSQSSRHISCEERPGGRRLSLFCFHSNSPFDALPRLIKMCAYRPDSTHHLGTNPESIGGWKQSIHKSIVASSLTERLLLGGTAVPPHYSIDAATHCIGHIYSAQYFKHSISTGVAVCDALKYCNPWKKQGVLLWAE
jgi:hypothetical protein